MKLEDIIITLLLLFVLFLVFRSSKSEFKSEIPGKTVWLLWLQGWDSAPKLIQQVRESWEKYNPEWNIELVDSKNLKTYIDVSYLDDVPTDAAKSDVIRLHLLAKHGGVWADSTMICMASLDNWIYDAVRPVGFWMWHGRDECTGPASWFIISQVQSSIIQKWKKACDDYWSKNSRAEPYHWMDVLFKDLLDNDSEFKSEWDKVPYLCCEDPGEAHMFKGSVNGSEITLQNKLKDNPPYALKLSRHDFVEDANTNGNFAIQLALDGVEFKKHEMKFKTKGDEVGDEDVIVAAECGAEHDARDLNEICKENNFKLMVFDKCNFCKHVPDGIWCRPLANVGRESHTYLDFTLTNYENFPKKAVLMPTPINKHGRKEKLERYIKTGTEGCGGDAGNAGSHENFTLIDYEGTKLKEAKVRPFKAWYETYIGDWKPELPTVCYGGLVVTTRDRIQKRKIDAYKEIHEQTLIGNHTEIGHFIERSLNVLF
jgi:hypothetical protein